jgi:cytoskeletal protein CcmA (bactofilin family)
MFPLKGRDRLADPKDAGKFALKPALYDPPGAPARPSAIPVPRPSPPAYPPAGEGAVAPTPSPRDQGAPASAPFLGVAAPASQPVETQGSKLSVGINIKLKGVEISDCDSLVIEGHVDATVNSKAMQIAEPGTLVGTALIDVAEIHGEFSGELTARNRLVIHGTGRVSGTIRYGQLIVAEGGELSGDVKRLESPEKQMLPSRNPVSDARPLPVPPRDREPT